MNNVLYHLVRALNYSPASKLALSLRSSYERDVRIIVAFKLFSFSSASFSIHFETNRQRNKFFWFMSPIVIPSLKIQKRIPINMCKNVPLIYACTHRCTAYFTLICIYKSKEFLYFLSF